MTKTTLRKYAAVLMLVSFIFGAAAPAMATEAETPLTQEEINALRATGVLNATGTTALTNNAVALGKYTDAGAWSFAVGNGTYAQGSYSVAMGSNTHTGGHYSMAIGQQSNAVGLGSFAGGGTNMTKGGSAYGTGSFAFGKNAVAGSVVEGETGVGYTGDDTFAFGENALASMTNAIALGKNSRAESVGSVALGANSVVPDTITTDTDPNGVISVGNSAFGGQRRIINVAAGSAETDAVNVGQLNAAIEEAVEAVGSGGDSIWAYDSDGGIVISDMGSSASGIGSISAGFVTTSTGDYSFAGGTESKTYGTGSFAFGNNVSTGMAAVRGGGKLQASAFGQNGMGGSYAAAFGNGSQAVGNASFAGGGYTLASPARPEQNEPVMALQGKEPIGSLATIVAGGKAYGDSSFAYGAGTVAGRMDVSEITDERGRTAIAYAFNGTGNVAMGTFAQATADNTLAIGWINPFKDDETAFACLYSALKELGENPAKYAEANARWTEILGRLQDRGTPIEGISSVTDFAEMEEGTAHALVNAVMSGSTDVERLQEMYQMNAVSSISGTTASGENAIAIGASTTPLGVLASSTNSIAIGTDARAIAENALALGTNSDAKLLGAVAIGESALADGLYSVSMGYKTTALDTGSVAIGVVSNAVGYGSFAGGGYVEHVPSHGYDIVAGGTAYGISSFAFGIGAVAGDETNKGGTAGTIAMGNNAKATHANSVALGNDSVTGGVNEISVGGGIIDEETGAIMTRKIANVAAGSAETDAVNVGQLNAAIEAVGSGGGDSLWEYNENGYGGIQVKGRNNNADGPTSTAMGKGTTAGGWYSTSMGYYTAAYGWYSTSIGCYSRALGNGSFAGGGGDWWTDSNVRVPGGTAYGESSFAFGLGTITGDADDSDAGFGAVAMGERTTASGNHAVAVGCLTTAEGDNSFAGSLRSAALGSNSFAFGNRAKAEKANSIAFGSESMSDNAKKQYYGGYALDVLKGNKTDERISDWYENLEASPEEKAEILNFTVDQLVEYIDGLTPSGFLRFMTNYSNAPVPLGAVASGENAIAIGNAISAQGTLASGKNSAVFGNDAQATAENALALGTGAKASHANSVALGSGSVVPDTITDANGVISVGSEGKERRIINVAAGSAETDAVNVGQLNAAIEAVGSGGGDSLWEYNNAASPDTSGIRVKNRSNNAAGDYSVAMGVETTAAGAYSTAMGYNTNAFGLSSVAMGERTAAGDQSVAMGYNTNASGTYSMAMGEQTLAGGIGSFAAGKLAKTGRWEHVTASDEFIYRGGGYYAAAMGDNTQAAGNASLAVGCQTTANGEYSVAMGYQTNAVGQNSAAMGCQTVAGGEHSFAMGYMARTGNFDESEKCIGGGMAAVAMGYETLASGDYSMSMGCGSKAIGESSVAMGHRAEAEGPFSVAMGYEAKTFGSSSISLGESTSAEGFASVAMGNYTTAGGDHSTAMGFFTIAEGDYSMAIGSNSEAVGAGSFAGGYDNASSEEYAETGSRAYGASSFAFGAGAVAGRITGESVSYDEENDPGHENPITAYTCVGDNAIAFGSSAKASENNTIAVGSIFGTIEEDVLNDYYVGYAKDVFNGKERNVDISETFDAIFETAIYVGKKTEAEIAALKTSLGKATKEEFEAAMNGLLSELAEDLGGEIKLVDLVKMTGARAPNGTTASGENAIAIGNSSTIQSTLASGKNSAVFGNDAQATAENALALGTNAQANAANSVALGANSVVPATITDANGVISVGSEGKERRIINVAAGTKDTDAVNYGQIIRSASYENNVLTLKNYNNETITTVEISGGSGNGTDENAVHYNTDKTEIALEGSGGTTIKNVAAGDITSADSTEAVNGGQLFETNKNVEQNAADIAANAEAIAKKADISALNAATAVTVNGGENINGGYGVEFAAGSNITLKTDGNKITISATGGGSSAAISTGAPLSGANTAKAHVSGTAVASGYNSVAGAKGSVASGFTSGVSENSTSGIAIGEGAIVGYNKSGYGRVEENAAVGSIAIGNDAKVTGINSIAVGVGHVVTGNNSGAFGDPNYISGNGSYAIGNKNGTADAPIATDDTFIFGSNVTKTAKNSVILGAGSEATEENTVSVGSATQQRRIVNVAKAENETDAVNYVQMKEYVAEHGGSDPAIRQELNAVSGEVKEVGAISAALAGLHYAEPSGEEGDKFVGAVAYGNYRGESAAAIGVAYKPNPNFMISASTSVGQNYNAYNAGASLKFGKGETAKTRAELQKQVKYLNDKNSTLESTVAAQSTKLAEQDERIKALENLVNKLIKK